MANITAPDTQFPFMQARKGVLISQEQMPILEDTYIGVALIVSFTGIVTNALNIKAFFLIGKEDGVSVSLLSLSLSDFGFCTASFCLISAFIFSRVEAEYDVMFFMDAWVINMFATNIGYAFYAMTSLTTTFLAVARCMCVAKPLHFNNTFTRSRSIAIHVCFAVVSIGGYIPVLSQMGARRAFDTRTNQTRIVAWMSDMREEVKDVVFLIFDTILTFTSQVVLIICVLIMTNSLRRSGRFRESTKAANTTDLKGQAKQDYKLSGKELQVIQQVVLISSMCIVCSLPKIFSASYSLIEPEFDVAKELHNFYFIIAHLRKTFELINSASTFFIYYKYNTRFRELYFGQGQ